MEPLNSGSSPAASEGALLALQRPREWQTLLGAGEGGGSQHKQQPGLSQSHQPARNSQNLAPSAASLCTRLSHPPPTFSPSECHHNWGAFAVRGVSHHSFSPVPLYCSDSQLDHCQRLSRTHHALCCSDNSAPQESPYSFSRERFCNSSPHFPSLTSHQQNFG